MDLVTIAQMLGNFGEFVGAIAVVATLGYLAVQVRESKAATEANTKQLTAMMEAEMTSHWLSNTQSLANDRELTEIFYRMTTEPDSISPSEGLRMFFWSIAAMKSGEFTFHQGEHGNLDGSLWQSNHALLSDAFSSPDHPWPRAWPSAKHMFSLDFQAYIDSLIPEETVSE
jgi:hypothetical protein